jgi:hypothetical protein
MPSNASSVTGPGQAAPRSMSDSVLTRYAGTSCNFGLRTKGLAVEFTLPTALKKIAEISAQESSSPRQQHTTDAPTTDHPAF